MLQHTKKRRVEEMCDINNEDTSVEIEMTEEEFETLEAYQKEHGFETLNELITYILKAELLKYDSANHQEHQE